MYYIGLIFEEMTLAAIRCVAADRSDLLLGRNVLNHFIVTLDGKRLEFEMLPA